MRRAVTGQEHRALVAQDGLLGGWQLIDRGHPSLCGAGLYGDAVTDNGRAAPPRLPAGVQLRRFRAALRRNETLTEVLGRATTMALPDWYLVAGCLYQTVWNVVTGAPPEAGILDYDLAYFDGSDLSWEAEDRVIQAGEQVFAGLPAPVQIRNQARVHLWYEQKFGVPCPPHTSTEAAIDTYEATTACVGVRAEPGGRWRVYAPHGLSDVFSLVVRPNPALAPREVYQAKVARWRSQWPSLRVLPWPVPGGQGRGCAAEQEGGGEHGGGDPEAVQHADLVAKEPDQRRPGEEGHVAE
jgi:hypothetical protein